MTSEYIRLVFSIFFVRPRRDGEGKRLRGVSSTVPSSVVLSVAFVLVQPIFEKSCRVGDRNADVLINFDQRIMLLITILYRYDNYWNINPLHSYTLCTYKLKLLKLLPHERAPFQLFATLHINYNYSSVEDRKTLYHRAHSPQQHDKIHSNNYLYTCTYNYQAYTCPLPFFSSNLQLVKVQNILEVFWLYRCIYPK